MWRQSNKFPNNQQCIHWVSPSSSKCKQKTDERRVAFGSPFDTFERIVDHSYVYKRKSCVQVNWYWSPKRVHNSECERNTLEEFIHKTSNSFRRQPQRCTRKEKIIHNGKNVYTKTNTIPFCVHLPIHSLAHFVRSLCRTDTRLKTKAKKKCENERSEFSC